MTNPSEVFEQALVWLRRNYAAYRFYTERDVVWTVQTHLQRRIKEANLGYRVYNDYPMLSGNRRSLSADLVILSEPATIEVAVEFKYEPSHTREDILKQKLPVVFWGKDGVGKDVARIREFVEAGKTRAAYLIFIDEGGYFRERPPHPGSVWHSWENGVCVLRAQVP